MDPKQYFHLLERLEYLEKEVAELKAYRDSIDLPAIQQGLGNLMRGQGDLNQAVADLLASFERLQDQIESIRSNYSGAPPKGRWEV